MTKCALGKVMRLMVSVVMAASLCPAVSYAQEFELSGSEMGVVSASDDESAISNPADSERSDAPSDANESGANASSGQVAGKEDSGEESPAAAGVPVISEDESSPASKSEGEGAGAGPEPTEPAGPEEKPGAPLPDGSYVVVPACSASRCLDVAGGSSADGADVRLWASNMTGAQRVVARADAETGLYELAFAGTGKALDVSGAGTAAGTNVQQWTANGTKAQRWAISENADGSYSVESALAEGLSLDVAGAGDFDGAGLDVWPANGTAAQRFSFIPAPAQVEPAGRTVDDGVYELVGAGSGKSLDVSGASRADGARAQIWARNATMAQMFRVALGPDGFYSVRAVHSGKALDADLGNVVPGARVNQWSDCGSANQRWRIDVAADGSWTLVNAASGLALDVCGGSSADGAAVQTWTPNGTAAQSWSAVPVSSLIPEGYVSVSSLLPGGRVLDVSGGSDRAGANAQTWEWNGTPAQRWLASDAGDGCVRLESLCSGMLLTQTGDGCDLRPASGSDAQRWRAELADAGGVVLVNAASGRALDVAGAGDWNGADVQTWTVNGTFAQSWSVQAVGCVGEGTYEVVCAADGRALDVSGASRADGANVQVWTRNDTGAQKWRLSAGGSGWQLLNCRSKKALDVDNAGSADGTNVQQWSSYGNAAQAWSVEYAGGGSYKLVNAGAGKPLDVAGAGGWDGANVAVWSDNGTLAQRFRLVPTTYTPENFTDLIGQFSTYSTNTYAGTYNMQRALNSFDGYIIWPGQTMSFFGVAGPCGAAEGYLAAGVVGGVGYGGGICQASTTLYGATLRAGLTIVERRNHSVPSTYVPIGLDAMVNYGTSDFRVRNDYDFPVMIVTSTPDTTLWCGVYGIQPEWFDYVEPISWYTSGNTASAQRIYYKDGRNVLIQWLPDSVYW